MGRPEPDGNPQPRRSATLTDRHIRILQLIAHHRQGKLHDYDGVDHNDDDISIARRRYLERAVRRTRARVDDAQARRRDS